VQSRTVASACAEPIGARRGEGLVHRGHADDGRDPVLGAGVEGPVDAELVQQDGGGPGGGDLPEAGQAVGVRQGHGEQDAVGLGDRRGPQRRALRDVGQQRPVRQHHAARGARGAGGVGEDGQVLPAARVGGRHRLWTVRVGKGEHGGVGGTEVADGELGAAVRDDPLDLPRRGVEPDRDDDRTRPQHAEQGHNRVRRVGQAQRDPVAGGDTRTGEARRTPVYLRLHLLPSE